MRLLIALFVVSFALSSQGHAENFQHSFFPENQLWLEDSNQINSNIDEELFDEIVEVFRTTYKSIAKEKGLSFGVISHWDDPKVNASCSRLINRITVNVYGGLARRPELTPEGLALILCHEAGHGFGGKPYASRIYRLAAEGQSDYYATNMCASKILSKLNLDSNLYRPTEFEKKACENYNGDYNECLQILTAGDSLAHLLASFRKTNIIPSYETPDTSVVEKTNVSYPSIQCRVDTYFRGLFNLNRPACWFKK